MNAKIPHRLYLNENEIPRQWYNLRADMKELPDPMLLPDGTVAQVEHIYPVFCKKLAQQEFDNTTRFVDIPDEILSIYKVYRPAPLCRAYDLEQALDTPAKIYYKFEGNNTSGSHKLNSAVAQAYYAKDEGLKGITTETGAGQWGTALAEAARYFGLELIVYMVKVSYEQKPFRKAIMQTFDAKVIASPSDTTNVGRAILAGDPGNSGSLGTAISEAIEAAVTTEGYRYVLGSVLNQVLLHQSIIGLETELAMQKIDEYPDIVIGCTGGGSNLGGLAAPFLRDKITGKANPRIIGAEPASCPSFTRGRYAYDFCDVGRTTPLAKMYTVGAGFIPSPNHAGGLRYHGMSPILSKLYHDGYMEAVAYEQTAIFEAAKKFAILETILPAPESAHAIKCAIDEALKCKETGEAKAILFGLSGTGHYDLTAYTQFNEGKMVDYIPTDEELEESLKGLPQVL